MEITEVKIKLTNSNKNKLKAFCSIIFNNALVVHDVKIIDGTKGAFVAMPSRKLTQHCARCASKNHLRSKFCNDCGSPMPLAQPDLDEENRPIFYADIIHPINSACREMIQSVVLKSYQEEIKKAGEFVDKPRDDFHHGNYDGQTKIL